jgi:hypothetical protein
MSRNLYTLMPGPGTGATMPPPQYVTGFREAIRIARACAESNHCEVTVRNEADCHTWRVAFRVKGSRRGAYTTVEVTR